MYKLLLITDREEVKNAFLKVTNWQQMMFHPITILEDVSAAIHFLESSAVDAVGYSVSNTDVAPLHRYLESRPSLPVFQTHKHDNTLRDELIRTRRFLDQIHADYADDYYDEQVILQMLRDELMQQLLRGEVPSSSELLSRIKLVRANTSVTKNCYLYDYDLPQGEIYLQDRWHYGQERLRNTLRTNFFGRNINGIYYDVDVPTSRHIRLIACPQMDIKTSDEELRLMVEAHVAQVVNAIKEYMDLDLNLEQFTILDSLYSLIPDKQND